MSVLASLDWMPGVSLNHAAAVSGILFIAVLGFPIAFFIWGGMLSGGDYILASKLKKRKLIFRLWSVLTGIVMALSLYALIWAMVGIFNNSYLKTEFHQQPSSSTSEPVDSTGEQSGDSTIICDLKDKQYDDTITCTIK